MYATQNSRKEKLTQKRRVAIGHPPFLRLGEELIWASGLAAKGSGLADGPKRFVPQQAEVPIQWMLPVEKRKDR